MSLLERVRDNHKDLKVLNEVSLDAIRVTIESCDCQKDKLCATCEDLLEYYKWRKEERKKYLDDRLKWLVHQIMIVFYGPKYKEQGLHFSRDIYTLKEIVELYDEYLKEERRLNDSSRENNS